MNEKLNTTVKILIGESLSIDDLNALSLLYMPIIGSRAYTLYMTLYSSLNRSSNTRVVKLSDIVDLFGITINTFLVDRKKLEAIGLLNTYSNDTELVFLLKAPLSARQFFNDDVLAIYLKQSVGDELFYKLLNLFKVESFDKTGYKNITDTFDNVFKKKFDGEKINIDGYLIDKKKNNSINAQEYSFDYDFFLSLLNLSLTEKNNLSAEFQRTIEKTAYAYSLKEEDMQILYHRSLDQAGIFSITKLQREARMHKKRMEMENADKATNPVDRFRYQDPRNILKVMVSDAKASDYEIIDKVVSNCPFNLDITNMVIFHAISKNNMKCPEYGYFVKVIETFEKYKIKSFDEAVNFVSAQGNYEAKEEKSLVTKKETKEEGSSWLKEFNEKFK